LGNLIAGIGVGVLGAVISISTLLSYNFTARETTPMVNDIKAIGNQLVSTQHNGYALPFEVISILLLAALIGAIIVAKKEDKVSETESK